MTGLGPLKYQKASKTREKKINLLIQAAAQLHYAAKWQTLLRETDAIYNRFATK